MSSAILGHLQTEGRNPKSENVDIAPTLELCRIINEEDQTVPGAVNACIPTIAKAIDALTPRIRSGGSLIYVGAGTSGRLGVLDASEIPPTFSASPSQFVGVVAGGDASLRSAQEGAEDSVEGAVADLEALNLNGAVDSLIGIAASGRTPYVISSLAFAKSKGCVTIGVACAAPSSMSQYGNVDFTIDAVTGPEVVTGSTRMKAGTATKLILNMISTAVMIKCGKTFGNIMIDVKPTNFKLQVRARRILREVCGDRCPVSDVEIDELLQACQRNVKLAAAKLILGISVEAAKRSLDEADGVLATILESNTGTAEAVHLEPTEQRYVLCVDGGGSSCRAAIVDNEGTLLIGEAGPCNPSDTGIEDAVATVKLAISRAVDSSLDTAGMNICDLHFEAIRLCLAGTDRKPMKNGMRLRLEELFAKRLHATIHLTNDIDLLASVGGHLTRCEHVLVLVAGTGSVAMRYQRDGNQYARVSRRGGWGALLGDDGSGFDIGRQAIRFALRQIDAQSWMGCKTPQTASPDPLQKLVVDYYRQDAEPLAQCDLLTSVLLGSSDDEQTASHTKRRIASCAKVAVDAMHESEEARRIVETALSSLTELARGLWQPLDTSASALMLAGGLMNSDTFREMVLEKLGSTNVKFSHIEFIDQPAVAGARFLAAKAWGSGSTEQ